MKVFILKILSFNLIILISISFGIGVINLVIRNNADFKINKKSAYVVFGHSHPECAFNDSLINNFSNYSQSGEAYFYTYFKAKKIIEQNKDIEIVFIEFTNNQIDINKNNWTWDDGQLNFRYDKYAPFMNLEEQKLLFLNNRKGFIENLSLSSRKNLLKILSNNLSYKKLVGGYRYLDLNKSDSIFVNSYKVPKVEFINTELPKTNIAYLRKLINYCNANGKIVFLIRSPLHENNLTLRNEKLFRKVLLENFGDTEFLDFVNFPLEDMDFYDLDHLNYKGARKFSIWINSLFEKRLLKIENKQFFIDQEIDNYSDNDFIF